MGTLTNPYGALLQVTFLSQKAMRVGCQGESNNTRKDWSYKETTASSDTFTLHEILMPHFANMQNNKSPKGIVSCWFIQSPFECTLRAWTLPLEHAAVFARGSPESSTLISGWVTVVVISGFRTFIHLPFQLRSIKTAGKWFASKGMHMVHFIAHVK